MPTPLEESVSRDALKAAIPFTGDPRDIEAEGTVQIGSKVRDAAVDPHPEDSLPPSNAGTADPHGSTVKAYEVGSSERNAFIEQDRIDHPEKYAGVVPRP